MDRPISNQMSAGNLSKAIDPTIMVDDGPRIKTLAPVGKQ
jgi:hypothetical protein